MGAIEDIRKVMQDFLAPELHGIKEHLSALDNGLRDLRDDIHKLFDKAEQHNETRYQDLVRTLNLENRMERLENTTIEERALRDMVKKQYEKQYKEGRKLGPQVRQDREPE